VATVLRLVLTPDDETAFFRAISGLRLEVYPIRVPPQWKPYLANEATLGRVEDDAVYLAAPDAGPVLVDRIKRGPDKGSWRVDEVRSPVIYYQRSHLDEEGALRSGKLWAELDITPQTGRRDAAPEHFRRAYLDVESWFKRTCRRSEPAGYWIGPHAARRFKEGLVLRDSEPRGPVLQPFR
jgi:hypothetical protein